MISLLVIHILLLEYFYCLPTEVYSQKRVLTWEKVNVIATDYQQVSWSISSECTSWKELNEYVKFVKGIIFYEMYEKQIIVH